MGDHDPEGLEVARMVAGQAKGASTPRPRTPSSRRPKASRAVGDPKPLGEAIEELIVEQGWSREVNLHQLLGRWPMLVGEVNAAHSQPERWGDGVLTVRTDSTAWATSLRLMAPQLVAKLNQELGQGTVLRVQIEGPDAPSWKHGRRAVRDGRGPRDTYG